MTRESTVAQVRGSIRSEGANVTAGQIRILVVEAHYVVRKGLVGLLEMTAGLEVVGKLPMVERLLNSFARTTLMSR